MKKIGWIFAIFIACALSAQALDTSASGACVLLTSDNSVLYGKNENTPMAMASTTKIATAIVAIENCPLDKKMTITEKEAGIEGSSMYLKVGEVYTLDELLYGLMMNSGNDAAAAVANLVAGNEADFVALMNSLAKRLGLENTSFKNPSGLDAKGHYTTARELAVLTSYALKNEDFCKYVSTKKMVIPADETRTVKPMVTKNRILLSYRRAIGVKTGYTVSSGRSLVTAAKEGAVTVVAVTIRDRNDWQDHKKMLDFGFENAKAIRFEDYVPKELKISVAGGGEIVAKVDGIEEFAIAASSEPVVNVQLVVPLFVYSGVGFMEQIGEAHFYKDGELFKTAAIRSYTSVPRESEVKSGFFQNLRDKFQFKRP